MFKTVRRRDRELAEDEARDILSRADHGVLATLGANGWPYAVPVNHVLSGNVIYIHCAPEGHKLENIDFEERVSYCAVAGAKVMPSMLSTLYESAVVFGRAALITDAAEKRKALILLVARFSGGSPTTAEEALSRCGAEPRVIRIQIERITGKAHRQKKQP